MLNTAFKTTSVLALCTALATPPGFAQGNGDAKTADLPLCQVTGPFPCVLEDGTRIKNARQFAKKRAGEAVDALTGEGAEDGATKDKKDKKGAAAEDASAEDQSVEEQAADEEAVDEDTPMAEDTGEVTGEDKVPEAAPAEDGDTAADAGTDDAGTVTETEAAAADAAEATATEEASDTASDAPAQADAPARPKSKDKPAAAAAADISDDEALDEALAEAEAGDDVTVETVTEDTSRSSDEDFATDAGSAGGGSGGTAEAKVRNGGGNSDDFAKALAIGLGALAVGAILANGARVVSNSGDRVVVENPDGDLQVLKNDDENLRQPGAEVRTRTFDDGSTRTVVTRENGVRIITIRAADGTALKRVRVMPDGSRFVLFDDTETAAPVEETPAQPAAQTIEAENSDALREALIASMAERSGRRYALSQVRAYPSVRDLAPQIEVRAITFPTNSAAIPPKQAERLADLGLAIADVVAQVPDAVFLVEGHTDAIGSDGYNLALSDRRAESVALALTEYFDVPPENLVTQGYGESDLKVPTQEANRDNRRVVVRNITPLLR